MKMTDLLTRYMLYRGKTVTLPINGMKVKVIILDLRTVWNRVDALVTPANGSGEHWIDADRLIIDPAPGPQTEEGRKERTI